MTRVSMVTLLALALLAAPLAAEAQQAGKVYRIGFLTSAAQRSDPIFVHFWEELRRLGYVEGQTLAVEFRTVEGKDDRLPALAADLVNLKVDLIVAPSSPAAQAAKGASRTIPSCLAYQMRYHRAWAPVWHDREGTSPEWSS